MVISPYDEIIWRPDHYAMVENVFPYARNAKGKRPGRNVLGRHYNKARMLRNRVVHFEQIFSSNRLIANHWEIHDGIGWIEPLLQSITESNDSFPAMYYNEKREIRERLQAFIEQGSDEFPDADRTQNDPYVPRR